VTVIDINVNANIGHSTMHVFRDLRKVCTLHDLNPQPGD